MKKVTLILFVAASHLALSQTTIIVDAAGGTETINKNIYGHFAEHLGHGIYGGLYVGEGNTKIPNKEGVRLDVVEALKKLKVPVLRWPGGCFADTYHWKDGVGPKRDRPAMLNVWWGGVKEDNSFGTNEFLNLCEALGSEAYLSGNVGSGTPQELSDWIKYTNHPNGSSPLADWRAKNGRANPWKVKFWGLGNEAWGCGGNMTPEYYANVYRQFGTFMTDWSNSDRIFRIASGANNADYHWTEVLMRDIPHNMLDAVGVHHYSVIDWNKKGSATAFSEQEYFIIMQRALEMETLIAGHSAVMDKYDPGKKVSIAVDEWGGWYDVEPGTPGGFLYQQNTMRDAMIAGTTLNIFNNHCDRVKMANLAQMVNVLQAVVLTNEEKIVLTPTYHVMEMYNVHQNAVLLPVTVNSRDYQVGRETLKAISVSSSVDGRGVIHISLVNIDARQSQKLSIKITGTNATRVTGRILKSVALQDHNTFETPGKIQPVPFTGATLKGSDLQLEIPAFSVVVLELR